MNNVVFGTVMDSYNNTSLYNALKELKVVEDSQLDLAFSDSETQKIPLEEILLKRDLISDENLGKTISELLSLPLVRRFI